MEKHGIVAFAFGVPSAIRSNQIIAQIASKKAKDQKALVFTQRDVSIGSHIEVQFVKEVLGSPPSTLFVATEAVKWADKFGLNTLWVAAARPHLWRCMRDLKQAVKESRLNIHVHICQEIGGYTDKDWFCPDSTMERTRNKENWIIRERILKLTPFFLYKALSG